MLLIPQIVKALRLSRDEFATLFLQAQVGRPARMNFEAVAQTAVGDKALEAGLQYADTSQFLTRLLHAIVDQEGEDGTLAEALLTESGQHSAELQAMVNLAKGFQLPQALYHGLFNGMKWACKLHIDGSEAGTGILIGPNLVLTAWHVVAPLFLVNTAPAGEFRPDDQAGSRLAAEFDNYDTYQNGAIRPSTSLRVKAHENWCVSFKSCHATERQKQLPDPLTELKDCWDYAIIRLGQPVGFERRWATVDPNAVVPGVGQRVMVFQHPAGSSLKIDDGQIMAPAVANPAVFPGMRFLHKVNTLNGSSGGPCFDQDFVLFGLHQGTWPAAPGQPVLNRGVPIAGIQAHIKQTISKLPDPDAADSPLWSLGEAEGYAPVLGCDGFHTTIWQSILAERTRTQDVANPFGFSDRSKRLFLIDGAAGSGKSFRVRVLSSMLHPADHLLIRLSAETISTYSAVEIVKAMAMQAGQPAPDLVPQAEMNTTAAAWLRAELLPKLLQVLETARNRRTVWFVLTDLNRANIDGPQATDLLALIYEQVATLGWLRVVLDGMRGDIPQQLDPYKQPIPVEPLTRADMATYLRKVMAQRNRLVDDTTIRVLTIWLERDYKTVLNGDVPKSATASLSRAMMQCVRDLIEVVSQPN